VTAQALMSCITQSLKTLEWRSLEVYHINFLIFIPLCKFARAHGSVVGLGTVLQYRKSQVQFLIRSLYFSVDLILPASLCALG
jgi:hypothetical protein